MNTTLPSHDSIRQLFLQPANGIVGLVDDLLRTCAEQSLQLAWREGRYRIRSLGGDWEELTDLPSRKSVFRAILARIAVLCNEQIANSVSPYGGQSELRIEANKTAIFKIKFSNTADEQILELSIDAGPAIIPSASMSD